MIDKMSEQEKSDALLKLVGWKFFYEERTDTVTGRISVFDENDKLIYTKRTMPKSNHIYPNIYHETNMALALRCIRWGMENSADFHEFVDVHAYYILHRETGINDTLDKMIKIYAAIEEGMVDV